MKQPRPSFDPVRAGCLCNLCPLNDPKKRKGPPVGPELKKNARLLIVGQEPSIQDAANGQVFSGSSGMELNRVLAAAGLGRQQVSLTSLVACSPVMKGGLDVFMLVRKGVNAKRQRLWTKRFKAEQAYVKTTFNQWWKENTAADRKELIIERLGGPVVLQASPIACCAPRLRREVAGGPPAVVTMGRSAAHAFLKTDASIVELRGATETTTVEASWPSGEVSSVAVKVVPTFNLALVQRERHLRWVVEQDLKKALRFFTDRLDWQDTDAPGRTTYNPSLDIIERLLFKQPRRPTRWVYDWETTKDDSLAVLPKCLGIGWYNDTTARWEGMVIPFRDALTLELLWTEAAYARLVYLIGNAYTDGRLWYGQNIGGFDFTVDDTHIGCHPTNSLDLLNIHKAQFPQQRHNLALITSLLTDATAYKLDEFGNRLAMATDNQILYRYNATDLYTTGEAMDRLLNGCKIRDVRPLRGTAYFRTMLIDDDKTLAQQDEWVQSFCRDLHRIGIYVRQDVRAWMQQGTEQAAAVLLTSIKKTAAEEGMPDFNPNSTPQGAELLYKRWKLDEDPKEMTKGGAPGTGAKTLRRIILDAVSDRSLVKLSKQQIRLVYDWMKYRRYTTKYLGTYLEPFAPGGGHVWADGRVRSSWAGHVTLVDRASSSRPNHQNLPLLMKHIYQPQMEERRGEMVYVNGYAGCDMEQLHPRLFSIRFGIPRLQQAFADKEDCYSHVGDAMFEDRWRNAAGATGSFSKKPKKNTEADTLRHISKVVLLTMAYGGAAPVVFDTLRKTVDDVTGDLVFTKLTLDVVKDWMDKIHRNLAGFEAGWARTTQRAKDNGAKTGEDPWLASPLSGRRRFFHNGVDAGRGGSDYNDALNFETLADEAALMHMLVRQLQKEYPLWFDGDNTGLFLQIHDSISLEFRLPIPSSRPWNYDANLRAAQRHQDRIVEVMSQYQQAGVPFPAEGSAGFDMTKA